MTYDPSKFYVWQATGTQLNIHLSLAVIEELNQRRAELDGDMSAVLLGYSMIAPHRATFVDDFVLLPPSWNLRGGAYSADFEATRSEIVSKLAEGAEYGRHAIGFCRWQQEGALELSGGDFAAAQRFFAETDNVLLLVRSLPYQVGEAALFYWDGGKLQVPEQSSHFPFEVNQLSSGRESALPRSRAIAEPLPPVPPPPPTERRPWSDSAREPIRWLRLLPIAGVVSLGIAAGNMAFNHDQPAAPPAPPAVTATAPAPAPIEEVKLGLKVTSLPKQLQIRWNHDAKPILNAVRGEMRITDGSETEVIAFDPSQLLDGAVAYTPNTNDVSIKFEVTAADGSSTAESVRAVAIP